jgi:hypothetical protein
VERGRVHRHAAVGAEHLDVIAEIVDGNEAHACQRTTPSVRE